MKKIQNIVAVIFIICVIILAAISILGVWKVLETDVITKAFQSLGLLAGVAVITMIAGHFMAGRQELSSVPQTENLTLEINPVFTSIRRFTAAVLIIVLVLLAFLGILSIWEVMTSDILHKAVSSMGIIVFSALIIVGTCLEREQHKILKQKISGGVIILVIIFGSIFLQSLF